MKKIVLFIAVVLSSYSLFAQQDAMYTHYMFNTLAVNPAYAGSRDALTVTGLYRHQWVSFPGAPVTQTITMHTPAWGDQLGLGLSFVNDKIGPSLTTSIYGDFAYRLKVNDRGHKFTFGLKAGVNLFNSNLTSLNLIEQNDVAFNTQIKNEFLPNFGAGIYYSAPKFYLGISSPKFLQNNILDEYNNNILDEKRHYFFIAGAMFNLNYDFGLKPTLFLKVVEGAPIEADVTASLYYRNKIWFGLGYRTFADASAMLGFQITEALAIGYSYDWSFVNSTMQYNFGSHEIMLRYDLIYQNENKIKSPRYF
jgi:type IX secretion system PorP/SprF family membrane protein